MYRPISLNNDSFFQVIPLRKKHCPLNRGFLNYAKELLFSCVTQKSIKYIVFTGARPISFRNAKIKINAEC